MKPSQDLPQINMEALAQLRKKIEAAVSEIHRLRGENDSLRDKVKALEKKAGEAEAVVSMFGDSDPEEMKGRIKGFIATIDSILGEGEDVAMATNGQNA